MKRVYKIFAWVTAVWIAILIALNLSIPLFAKKIIVESIEKSLKVKTSLESVTVTPPLLVSLNNLKIGDFFSAERISVYPNILGLLAGKIVLSGVTLVNPVINLEQSREGKLNIPEPEAKGKQPPIYITGLKLKDGKFTFIDKKVQADGFKIILSRINADISKMRFPPTSLKINFKVSADILKGDESRIGDILFSGWVDFGPKDMDAKLNLNGLDITYFQPYYGDFISERELLSARLDIQSSFKSEDNDLGIVTNLKLSDLVYRHDREDDIREPSFNLAKSALDLFTDRKGNLLLEFRVKTKLDSPVITIKELKKIILAAVLKNIASQNPRDLIGKISDNIEQFEDFGKRMKELFKGKD